MPLQAYSPAGNPIDSQVGVTPIFLKLEPGLLKIIGTGFYIARYGLLLTAKHVVDEIVDNNTEGRPKAAWIWKPDGTVNFRPIHTCSFDHRAPLYYPDIAICQAVDSAKPEHVAVLQINERIGLSTRVPPKGAAIATYAYPDNHRLDFASGDPNVKVIADAFEGTVQELIGPEERMLRYEHVEASMTIRGGASGGPVFGPDRHAFAVNCRGWDFGAEQEPLSTVVPVSAIFDLEFRYPIMPPGSWESESVPQNRRGGNVSLRDLARWGHISIDAPSA